MTQHKIEQLASETVDDWIASCKRKNTPASNVSKADRDDLVRAFAKALTTATKKEARRQK